MQQKITLPGKLKRIKIYTPDSQINNLPTHQGTRITRIKLTEYKGESPGPLHRNPIQFKCLIILCVPGEGKVCD